MDEGVIRCEGVSPRVNELQSAVEHWVFWSDGRELLRYCPECSEHELGGEETKTEPLPLVHPRAATNGS